MLPETPVNVRRTYPPPEPPPPAAGFPLALPPAPPAPQTSTVIEVTPDGTVQDPLPVVVKV